MSTTYIVFFLQLKIQVGIFGLDVHTLCDLKDQDSAHFFGYRRSYNTGSMDPDPHHWPVGVFY